MNTFKDFQIKPASISLAGEKIQLDKIINCEIVVHSFKVEDSSKKAGTKCLHLQISFKNENRVVFTGAKTLIETIQRVPVNGFPFKATIVKENGRHEFR